MINSQLEKSLSGIEGLPTLPVVLQHIQKVISRPNSNMSQIAAVVVKDQALTSRVIRLVNSAWYSRSTRVTSIQQAIVTLGLKTLNNLMIGLSVIKMFDSTKTLGYDPQLFWEHTFGTAILADKLAQLTNPRIDRGDCFIAGLLHDLGRLVLEQFLHEEFIAALQKMQENKMPLLQCEIEVFGFSHADTGAWLGRQWNIPPLLISVMEFHHNPENAGNIPQVDKEILRIVAAANELAEENKIGSSSELYLETNVVSTIPKLTRELCAKIVEETRHEVISTLNEWNRP